MAGFIKLFRKITQWSWYDKPTVRDTFIHLLLTANYKPNEWHGQIIEVGQTVTSIAKLSLALGFSNKQIRSALDKLQESGEIVKQRANKHTLISVVKFKDYQEIIEEEGQTKGKQKADKGQTKGKQRATLKEYKEDKNKRNNINTSKNQEILSLFNSICVSLPKAYKLTELRKSRIAKAEKDNVDWKSFFEKIEKSSFLTGKNNKGWRATFDWIINPTNLVKILEGNYDNRQTGKSIYSSQNASYDLEAYASKSMFDD